MIFVAMSYLRSEGYIVGGSELADLLERIYGKAKIAHMMTGHAYSGHFALILEHSV